METGVLGAVGPGVRCFAMEELRPELGFVKFQILEALGSVLPRVLRLKLNQDAIHNLALVRFLLKFEEITIIVKKINFQKSLITG